MSMQAVGGLRGSLVMVLALSRSLTDSGSCTGAKPSVEEDVQRNNSHYRWN
jgi:hypothetical protein